jgi:outer membrane lipoprotein carrier protein
VSISFWPEEPDTDAGVGERLGRRGLRRGLAALGVLLAAAALAAGLSAAPRAGDRPDPTTAQILERFDRVQQETGSLVARFTEEKHLRLLAEPKVSRGRFYFNRPNQVRWEYDGPESKVFVITESRYVAYFPAARRAEDVDIRKFVGKRLFRFLALGQTSGDLQAAYHIARAIDATSAGTHLLVLTPRRDRVRDRLAVLRIWVDGTTWLPRRIAYEEPDGDRTVLTFHDLRANVELAESRFRVELPAGVEVSPTFNGLALGSGAF